LPSALSVAAGKPGQVLPYLLSARLADLQLAPDTPYSGHLAAGEVPGEQLGRRVPRGR